MPSISNRCLNIVNLCSFCVIYRKLHIISLILNMQTTKKMLQAVNLQHFRAFGDFLVPRPGIEPGWIAPLVFETSASTDSAIWA